MNPFATTAALPLADRDAIARELLDARDRREQRPLLTARFSGLDAAAAYDVARRVHEARLARGERAAGRKIGFTNPATWPVFNVSEPIWSHVYDSTVVHLPAGRAVCRLGGRIVPRIEPEVVFHLARTPRPGAGADELLACVDRIAQGFEIVVSPYPDWKFTAADCIAGGVCHALLLVGEPRDVHTLGPDLAARLKAFGVELLCDGRVRDRGTGANVMGSPLEALAHLSQLLARQPWAAPLAAGEWVTTGTLTQALPVRAGETWSTVFQGLALPQIEVAFED